MHGLVFLWTGCFAQNLQCLWHGGNPTHRPPTACGAAAYGLVSHLFKHWWGLCLNSSMQLVDSFCFFCFCFIFSHTDEDFFVWTVQGNLLIPFFIFLISSHTDEVFEQFKGTCWLIFSPSVLTQMRTLLEQFKAYLLTHFSSVLMQMRTLFEQFRATGCSFFISSHIDENCLNSWRQLVDLFLHIFMQTMTFFNSWRLRTACFIKKEFFFNTCVLIQVMSFLEWQKPLFAVFGYIDFFFFHLYKHKWGLWLFEELKASRWCTFNLFLCSWGLCLNSSRQLYGSLLIYWDFHTDSNFV